MAFSMSKVVFIALLPVLCAGTQHKFSTLETSKKTAVAWSKGKFSWKQVREETDDGLWDSQNGCDTRAMRGSAPLTTLFGLSNVWDHIKEQRRSRATSSGSDEEKPLEIHVVGAAYPFEGRSDWSLLASRRPPEIPKVRVVLVLGTPWQSDTVPDMEAEEAGSENQLHLEADDDEDDDDDEDEDDDDDDEREAPLALLQVGSRARRQSQKQRQQRKSKKPAGNQYNDGEVTCTGESLHKLDASFKKEDFCKDHGNGLEVVCLEKFYQQSFDELPKPDAVVMFSPGFPQLGRRTWDTVLRKVLDEETVLMVGDQLDRHSWKWEKHSVAPGSHWKVEKGSKEDGMTWMGLDAYGAKRLGAWRSPFPLLIDRGEDDKVGKNAILQIFAGRRPDVEPESMPSKEEVEKSQALIEAFDFTKAFGGDKGVGQEFKDSLLQPVSSAYARGTQELYEQEIRRLVQERGLDDFTPKQRKMLEAFGLTSKPMRLLDQKRGRAGGDAAAAPLWGPEAYLFFLKELDASGLF